MILVPFRVNAETAFTISPSTVPEAVMLVAPVIAPALVIPPRLLSRPADMLAPLTAVKRPADVIVPVPVVTIFPLVVRSPSSSIVSVDVPFDLTFTAIPDVPAAVSFKINALAVPAFVNVNEVGDPRPPARVNAIFLPVVVVIVFPLSYAVCNVDVAAVHVAIWLDAFLHNDVVPLVPSVVTCVRLLKIICPVPFGVRVRSSFVPVVMSVGTPLKVNVPVVVIAPDDIVPIFTRFPDESILSVPLV